MIKLSNYIFSHLLSLMNTNQDFFIKIGNLRCYFFNISLFQEINWRNSEENSWIWFALGIDMPNGRVFWSISSKNMGLSYNLLFPIQDVLMAFSITSTFNINIGGSNLFHNFCSCQIQYFKFYFNKFLNNIVECQSLQEKHISLLLFYFF